MSIALICGSNIKTCVVEPIAVSDLNIEDSFFTDAPSIRAAFGFAENIFKMCGSGGALASNLRVNSVALLIHDFKRDVGTVAYAAATINYINQKDTQNPPRPVEARAATAKVSIVVDYDGELPDAFDIENAVNGVTARYNGGVVDNFINVKPVDDAGLIEYLTRYRAWQVVDRSDLKLTTFGEMLEYVAFYKNPRSGSKDLKKHEGVFYLHQTGYQLLEEPTHREGSLTFNGKECRHAFCEPIINVAGMEYSSSIGGVDNLCFWRWVYDVDKNTANLTTY